MNPFSSRFIGPTSRDFISTDQDVIKELLQRLEAHSWKGAIIGPHGSGKSTLVNSLKPEIRLPIRHQVIRSSDSKAERVKEVLAAIRTLRGDGLLILDGFEQFGFARRLLIRWSCWWNRVGLLVTAHHPVGLPVVYQTNPSEELFLQIVDQMQTEEPKLSVETQKATYQKHGPNIREALFALYDEYEELARE